jgi:hypothetical protein
MDLKVPVNPTPEWHVPVILCGGALGERDHVGQGYNGSP